MAVDAITPGPAPETSAARGERRAGRGALLLAAPAAAAMALFLLAPFAAFAVFSVLTGGVFRFDVSAPLTLSNFTDAFSNGTNAVLARNSLIVGASTAAATSLLAVPIAYWLRYSAGRLQVPVLFLITATIFASYLVRIYAWRTTLGPNGIVNRGLQQLGIIDAPLAFLSYSRLAVTIALVHIMLPFVVLMVFAALRPLDPRYLEAAEDLGASTAQRWRRIVLPLIAAPLAAAFMFTFIVSASDYVTPQFLGGSRGSLIGVQIQNYFKSIGDYGHGAALAVAVLVAFLVLYGMVALALRALRLNNVRWGA